MSVSSNIVELASPSAVEAAWQALIDHRRPAIENPGLLIDRGFMEKDARLYERFRKLFMADCCSGANVVPMRRK